MKDGVEQLAFEQTLLRFSAQREDVSNLRNQASISAAVTGLIGTVFASILGNEGAQRVIVSDAFLGLSLMGGILVLLFSASLFFSATVLIWHEEFTFAFDPEEMEVQGRNHVSKESFLASYISDGAWYFDDNERKIERAQGRLWWAMVLGWCQIFPWIILIVGSANGG